MRAVLLVDALKQVCRIVLRRHFLVVDDVDTGLVESHGVGAGEDAIIFQLHGSRMVDTVTVDAHIVHHADINDAVLFLEIVHHGLSGSSHALQKGVLRGDVLRCPHRVHIEFVHLTSRMDVGLSVG